MKISVLKPTLDAHNVKMVAVGLEHLGAEEFVQKAFFDGGTCVYTIRPDCKQNKQHKQKVEVGIQ